MTGELEQRVREATTRRARREAKKALKRYLDALALKHGAPKPNRYTPSL